MNNNAERSNRARAYIIAILTTAYRKPNAYSYARVLEITIIQQMIKAGYSHAEAASGLMYLEKMGRIDLDIDTIESQAFGKPTKVKWKYYSLSESSLNDLEGQTKYTRKQEHSLQITNQSGNLVIGSNNIIGSFNTYEAIFNDLNESVKANVDLSNEQKTDVLADIETIKAQLKKRKPSVDIIKAAWGGLQFLSTTEGVTQFFTRAKEIIEPLLS